MVGQTISHYKIIDKLGQGGMGEVYLAEDTKLDRKVALKFLPDLMHQDPVAEKRFLREAKSAAALDHPFICNIYEAGVEDGKSFISMEYVQGENLKDKLEKSQLPLKDALEMATEIAEALETAHKANIVHRDLKPSNIMLTPDGHVKVMDFGLAKQLFPARDVDAQEQAITASLTKTGMTLGTLAYMSPEQLRGDAVDTRSDIFSFGIMLYEMITGVDPFRKSQGAIADHVDQFDAVYKLELHFGDCVQVRTLNSTYSIQVLDNDLYSVSGGWFDLEGLSPFRTSIKAALVETFAVDGRRCQCEGCQRPDGFEYRRTGGPHRDPSSCSRRLGQKSRNFFN